MSRVINEQETIQVQTEVNLVSASVRRFEMFETFVNGDLEKRNADGTAKTSDRVEGDIGAKTVEEALADIENATGVAPDVSTLTVQDFINSLIHQIDADGE